jgi:hypothetical protein
MVELAILPAVGCPDWEEHLRQDRRRYAKDTVNSTFIVTRPSRANKNKGFKDRA